MSEEQMNDSTFSRLFIIMVIVMSVMTAIIMVLASMAASDVNTRLDERSEQENSAAISSRIAPVGQFSAEVVAPVAQAAAPILGGEEAYGSCAACHASGVAGAPIVGDASVWASRLAQGVETLYDHAINGYQGASGVMPAKGGNTALADESVKAAVDYMLEKSK
jgi:cytochrome c5